jgi:hypothetical protein
MSAPLAGVVFLGMYVLVLALLLHSLLSATDWRPQLESPSVQQNPSAMQAYLLPTNHGEAP